MERLTERVFAFNGTSCMQIKACGNDTCDETCRNITGEKGCEDCPIQIAIDKLAEYEDLEEQNRLLKLPCAVGDKIYLPNEYAGKVIDFEIIEICVFKEEIMFIDDSENEYFISDFGKSVFLTREEAESALKELERGKGE